MTGSSSQSAPPPLPVGVPVEPAGEPSTPRRAAYEGRHVTLRPVDPDADLAALHEGSHGDALTEQLWTYMGYGPFASRAAMGEWLAGCATSTDPLFLTVHSNEHRRPVGVVTFLAIVPEALRLELGHIWYVPDVQRTRVNTESVYLMLAETFDRLGYRRCEWKCDALNARSRAAAARLGFSFEGIFRQHLVVKGRNRDTAWFAITDDEWPAIKANFERWLYRDDPGSLRDLNAPLLRDRVREI